MSGMYTKHEWGVYCCSMYILHSVLIYCQCVMLLVVVNDVFRDTYLVM